MDAQTRLRAEDLPPSPGLVLFGRLGNLRLSKSRGFLFASEDDFGRSTVFSAGQGCRVGFATAVGIGLSLQGNAIRSLGFDLVHSDLGVTDAALN